MIVKKGQWYTLCCHLDLEEALEDEEYDDDRDYMPMVFETEIEGLEYFLDAAQMHQNKEEEKEILGMLVVASLKKNDY